MLHGLKWLLWSKNSEDKRKHNVFKNLQLPLLPKTISVGVKKEKKKQPALILTFL